MDRGEKLSIFIVQNFGFGILKTIENKAILHFHNHEDI